MASRQSRPLAPPLLPQGAGGRDGRDKPVQGKAGPARSEHGQREPVAAPAQRSPAAPTIAPESAIPTPTPLYSHPARERRPSRRSVPRTMPVARMKTPALASPERKRIRLQATRFVVAPIRPVVTTTATRHAAMRAPPAAGG